MKIKWGTTFSIKYCDQLNLEWRRVLHEIIDEFDIGSLRIACYWDRIESKENVFDFSEVEEVLDILKDSGIEVTLSFGMKSPRWPEFHLPDWTEKLDDSDFKSVLFRYIQVFSNKYGNDERIKYFQVENEPLYNFGRSIRKLTPELLSKELEIVREYTDKNIIITESGENGDWQIAASYGDRLGINMYSIVFEKVPEIYKKLPFGPGFYRDKKSTLDKPVFVAELQAEPWGPDTNAGNLEYREWKNSISSEQLIRNTLKAIDSGFKEIWFWGIEWWIKVKKSNPEIFDTAKLIINSGDFIYEKKKQMKENKKYLYLSILSLAVWIVFVGILLFEIITMKDASLGIVESLMMSPFARGMFVDIGILTTIIAGWMVFVTKHRLRWLFAILTLFIGSGAVLPFLGIYFYQKWKD